MLPDRSWDAIRGKSRELGLPQGVPQGCWSVKEATVRTGYARKELLRALELAQVPIRSLYPGQHRKVGNIGIQRRAYVEIDAVLEAVKSYDDRETINALAARIGMSQALLWRWLRDAGMIKPSTDRKIRIVHRVKTTEAMKVVEMRRARYTPRNMRRCAKSK